MVYFCALVTAALVTVPAVSRAEVIGEPLPPPPTEILDLDAKPVLDWSVPGRYADSWAHWNPTTATYSPEFVNPSSWSMNLDGCASTSLYRITRYTFMVEQLGTTWKQTHDTTACELHLHNILPAQGLYRITLTLHTQGAFPGVSVPASRNASIRDYLIVSMGDSLASGEGNPDVPGSYDLFYNVKGKASVTHVNAPAQWKDTRCHRSANSGPALAAKAYEDADPKTSVTFLSVACSGAEIRHLINTRQDGAEPIGASTVPPQIDAIASLVGPDSSRGERQIDALLISAGVNDLHFSEIIERCASNWDGGFDSEKCVTDGGIADQLAGLPAKYDALAAALRTKLPNTREVYLNNYPGNVFRGGACGSLHFTGVGISSGEAEEMHTWGIALGWKIAEAAERFRGDTYRWNLIGDLDAPFSNRAYCDNPTWFTSYEQSWATQGNKLGTAHPNAAGHQAYRNLIRNAVVLDQSPTYYRRLTIVIQSVKAARSDGNPPLSVETTLYQDQAGDADLTRWLSVPRDGQWTPIPAAEGTFTLDVFVAPAAPRHATGLYMVLYHSLPISGTRTDNYGAGTHEFTHPTGGLAVRYSVVVKAPPGPPGNA
jgi:hypothetical protein